jgi:hypothetical protein
MLPETVTFNPREKAKEFLMSPFGVATFFGSVWLCFAFLTKDNAPAWVQAFGSVGAIWATARVAGKQQREQAKYRLEKDRVVIAAIAEVARASSMAVNRLFELASTGQTKDKMSEYKTWIEYVERQYQTAKGIELISLPQERMIQPFLQLIHNIQSAAESSRKYIAGAQGDDLRSVGTSMKFNKAILESLAKQFADF